LWRTIASRTDDAIFQGEQCQEIFAELTRRFTEEPAVRRPRALLTQTQDGRVVEHFKGRGGAFQDSHCSVSREVEPDPVVFMVGPLKDPVRIFEKARNDYANRQFANTVRSAESWEEYDSNNNVGTDNTVGADNIAVVRTGDPEFTGIGKQSGTQTSGRRASQCAPVLREANVLDIVRARMLVTDPWQLCDVCDVLDGFTFQFETWLDKKVPNKVSNRAFILTLKLLL
jgi:hypothetical protein